MAAEVPENTLQVGEAHPMAREALSWLREVLMSDPVRSSIMHESLASTALSGNRTAQICHETLRRLTSGESVSDRYLLGLCWFVKQYMEASAI